MNSCIIIVISISILLLLVYTVNSYFSNIKRVQESFVNANNTVNLNLDEVNCYNYMMSKDDKKNWIDTTSDKKNNRLRVLGTLRTNTTMSGGLYDNNVSATDACYIPTDVADTLFDITMDDNSCTLRDALDNTKTITFEKTNNGCKIDFDNSNFDTKEKFNNFLDMAYSQYDKELIQQIVNLTKMKNDLDKHCTTMRINKLTLENENKNLDTFNLQKQNDINTLLLKLSALDSLIYNDANFDTVMNTHFNDQNILTYDMKNNIQTYLSNYRTAKQVLSNAQNEKQRLNDLDKEVENNKIELNKEYNDYMKNNKP